MFISGEPSGDALGAELALALKTLLQDRAQPAEFFGAGGQKMKGAGVDLALDLTVHAVVGIVEVLKNYRKFKRIFDQLLDLAFERQPDAVVLIDYPGFNLRFAQALKKRLKNLPSENNWNPQVVFYVSPQIWAWHESRIHQIAQDIDLLLAIFPFEKEWYAARKPDFHVEFVGHPLIDRYAAEGLPFTKSTSNGATHQVLFLPGSRIRELKKHLPPMFEAARLLSSGNPEIRLKMVLPTATLLEMARSFPGCVSSINFQLGSLASALSETTVAIASSGTVTMECAYFRVPTVVLYRTSASTYFLGRRFIKVKYLAMPNLLADKEIYPEFIQNEASGENLAAAALKFIDSDKLRSDTRAELDKVIASLGERGASFRAASVILKKSLAH
ncbi:MAG: lipid-A-disaccharide synthase [Verrucomicrobiales bacterium]